MRRFQDARLFPSLTVFETLLVALDQRLEVHSAILSAAQLPQSEKVAKADFVIENAGPPELLRAQVSRVLDKLRAGYTRRGT